MISLNRYFRKGKLFIFTSIFVNYFYFIRLVVNFVVLPEKKETNKNI